MAETLENGREREQARLPVFGRKKTAWPRRAFWRAALAFSIGLPELATANKIAGHKYLVKRGDTLSHLALRFHTTVKAIQRANGLKGDIIRIGQILVIPSRLPELKYIRNVATATRSIAVADEKWKWLVVHHSAVDSGNAKSYDYYHRKVKGIRDGLAYHFVIGNGKNSGDGEVEIGPRWTKQLRGGHVQRTEVNDHGIGICLVGNFEKHPPTRRQLSAFTELTDFLQEIVLEKKCRFAGHKEIDPGHTLCPGRHFPLQAFHAKYD